MFLVQDHEFNLTDIERNLASNQRSRVAISLNGLSTLNFCSSKLIRLAGGRTTFLVSRFQSRKRDGPYSPQ